MNSIKPFLNEVLRSQVIQSATARGTEKSGKAPRIVDHDGKAQLVEEADLAEIVNPGSDLSSLCYRLHTQYCWPLTKWTSLALKMFRTATNRNQSLCLNNFSFWNIFP